MSAFQLTAQQNRSSVAYADSILSVLTAPFEKVDTLLAVVERLHMSGLKTEAKQYSKVALDLAIDSDYKERFNDTKISYGIQLYRTLEYDSSLYYLKHALKQHSGKEYRDKGDLYTYIAQCYMKKNLIDSASQMLTRAEAFYKDHDPYKNWIVYHNWYRMYAHFGDYDSAGKYLKKAHAITKERMNPMQHGYILYFLRQLAQQQNDLESYALYTKEYYDMNRKAGIEKELYTHGFDLAEGKSIAEQINLYEQLIAENTKINFNVKNHFLHIRLAELYMSQNKGQKAIENLLQIDTSIRAISFLIKRERMLAESYEMINAYEKANSSWKNLLNLETDEYKKEKKLQLLELEKKYQTAQKEQELALAQVRQEAQEAELARTRKQRNAYIMTALFLILLLGLIGYLAFQNRKKNQLLQEQNEQISEALKDKEVLLREIHHRVKNNLQVVSSLLNLQSQYISDEEALKAIVEGKNRVSSMALIHQSLYREDGLTSIDTQEYFGNLVESLLDSYQVDEEEIALHMNVAQIDLDVETMIPLGLIANELISNALKHAFRQKRDGNTLHFGLWEENGKLHLEIKDNGVGMDSDAFFNSDNFGNKLIQAFQKKLGAEIEVENIGGSRILLHITQYKKAA